jgi:hypothetical protein
MPNSILSEYCEFPLFAIKLSRALSRNILTNGTLDPLLQLERNLRYLHIISIAQAEIYYPQIWVYDLVVQVHCSLHDDY